MARWLSAANAPRDSLPPGPRATHPAGTLSFPHPLRAPRCFPGTCPGCSPELGACEPEGGRRTAATPEEVGIQRSLRCAGPGLLGLPGQGHQGRFWEGIRVATSLNSVAYFSRRKMSPPQGCLGPASLLPLLGYLRDWQLSPRNIFWMERKYARASVFASNQSSLGPPHLSSKPTHLALWKKILNFYPILMFLLSTIAVLTC